LHSIGADRFPPDSIGLVRPSGQNGVVLPHITPADAALLDVAGRDYRFESNREAAAWDELGLRWTTYHQRLNALIDTEAALAHAPLLVKRLQRVRDARIR
jgi:hypothetical protein